MSLQPLCAVSCPQPVAEAWSQPCVTSCGDSRAVIHPPPVVITFPGPILSSCSQESAVGSAFPSGMGNSFGPCEPRAAFGGKNFSSSSSCYSRYSYPCYSRNFSSYSQNFYPCYPRISRPPFSRPAKPGKDSPDEQTQQKKEQIQQKKEQIRKL